MAAEEGRPRVDVPAQDAVERALSLVQDCPDMLSLHDVGGRYLYASPAARDVLGYEPEELVGSDGYALMHPDDVAAVQEVHDEMVAVPRRYVLRGRCRHKDGSWVWCESTIRMVFDPRTGQPTHGVSSTRRILAVEEQRARIFLVDAEAQDSEAQGAEAQGAKDGGEDAVSEAKREEGKGRGSRDRRGPG